PTKQEALRACEHLRLLANAEHPQRNVTMRGLIDRYIEEVLKPCLDVPLGGTQDEASAIGYGGAYNYNNIIKNWIIPRWEQYVVSDFERPAERSEHCDLNGVGQSLNL